MTTQLDWRRRHIELTSTNNIVVMSNEAIMKDHKGSHSQKAILKILYQNSNGNRRKGDKLIHFESRDVRNKSLFPSRSFEYSEDEYITYVGFSFNNIKEIFQDYCKISSVHGVRYFTEPKRHWSERMWWIITMTLSVIGSILLTKEVYNKWQRSPVIVSFAEKYTRVSDIPFPAVTICPETKARSSLLNFTDLHDRWLHSGLEKLEHQEKERLHKMIAVLQICSDTVNQELKETANYNFSNNSIFKIIQELAPTFNETMMSCKFQNQEKPCHYYFEEIITEEGLCFTFNALALTEIYTDIVEIEKIKNSVDKPAIKTSKHWSLDSGYAKVSNSSYPRRVFGSGSRDGLAVTLSLNRNDFDEKCRSQVQGFKIQLHMPGVIPQLSKHYFYMPMQQDLLASVNPQIIKTDEDLDHYKPHIRQCFFSDEKPLHFFRTYTKSNCDFECLTNFTLSKCGCVRFSMPRNSTTQICGIKNIDCCVDAEDELARMDDALLNSMEFDDCNCLPACTSFSYDSDLSHNIITSNSQSSNKNEIAIVRIFFNKKQFISSKRSKLYGHTELLANFGGLLGLFLGISLLSFVELIYFFTLRTFLLIKKKFLPGEDASSADVNDIKNINPLVKNVNEMPFLVQRGAIIGRGEPIRRGY